MLFMSDIRCLLPVQSERLRDDEEVVSVAVRSTGFAFSYASERIRKDKKIMLRLLKTYNWHVGRESETPTPSLEFVGDNLKADKEFMLEVLKRKSELFWMASEKLRKDVDFILQAIYNIENSDDISWGAPNENYNILEYLDKETREMVEKKLSQ